MNKISLSLLILLLITSSLQAQVSVTTDGSAPDASAMLDVQSSMKGMLVPRMTTAQRTAIGLPAEALLVYDLDTKSFWYVKQSAWTEISSTTAGWSLNGNAGTNPEINFIGTTDKTSFKIQVNSKQSGWIDPEKGNTGFGYRALIKQANGEMNTAIGYETLDSNISGYENTASGFRALYRNSAGSYNTAFGARALSNTTTSALNTACGFRTLQANITGCGNAAFGAEALNSNIEGCGNTALGGWASQGNSSGAFNTAAGHYSLFTCTEGSFNTAIGHKAGYYLTEGNDNLFLGSFSGPVFLQELDSSMWIGNTGVNQPALYGDLTDGRIGVGTSNPHPSAKLDISSTSMGFLPPRLTTEQIEAIENPANGLVVFCSTDNRFYAYLSVMHAWKEIAFGTGIISTFQCGDSLTVNHLAGASAPVTKTVTYGTVNNVPGEPSKCWMASNLGADRQALSVDDATEASSGWYWQFNQLQGYRHDGTTRTPGMAWIDQINENQDWNADFDPCFHELGGQWRIPSYSEWVNVQVSGNWSTWNEPWGSLLKLHAAGGLMYSDGSVFSRGIEGNYWTSKQFDNTAGYRMHFNSSSCNVTDNLKTCGYPLRCVME